MKVAAYRKENDVTYALGATVAMEYLNHNIKVVKGVIVHPSFRAEETKEKIFDICKKNKIEVSIEEKPFNILSKKENCFVIAVISKSEEKISQGNHIVLINPSNAGNLGTIMRSSLGFGVEQMAIITPATDNFDPKTIRASMGAAARMKVEKFKSFDEYSERFRENNFYPFMLDGSSLMQETEIKSNFSLIMGNEATGLPSEFSEIGHPIRIEHTTNIDSLNLPIATSIALYEATKGYFISGNNIV